jgi:hypothetical protein
MATFKKRLKHWLYVPVYYNFIKVRNRFRRLISARTDNIFVFILCPPFCGSTLLNEFVSTSSNVSSNNLKGTREGQQLPGVRHLMWDHDQTFEPTYAYNWKLIKSVWLRYWDTTRKILLDKSPSNIVRAKAIEHEFQPSFFISMVRNPYAHAESLLRRSRVHTTPEKAASFAVFCLEWQKKNIEGLHNVIFFTYEDLTNNKEVIKQRLAAALPELADIDTSRVFKAHNFKAQPMAIKDLNNEKIAALRPEQLAVINNVFTKHADLLNFFGYELRSN